MINFISSFYLAGNIERQEELDTALKKNIEQPLIKNIYLFLDNRDAYKYLSQNFKLDKVKIKLLGNQPRYSDLFICANSLQIGEICMISNNDIWLKNISSLLLLTHLEKDMVYSITRYEKNLKLHKEKKRGNGSSDSFIFRTPVPKEIIENTNHVQNVWGSENVVNFEFMMNNFKLYNPCYHIITVHEHKNIERSIERANVALSKYKNHDFRIASAYPMDKKINNIVDFKNTNNAEYLYKITKSGKYVYKNIPFQEKKKNSFYTL
jgi:hypothetical protein